MAITFISTSELIVAENHPFFADIKNRGGIYIQAQIAVEHDASGVHDERENGIRLEIGSYTGNGTNRTLSFTDTGLNPLYMEVWHSHAADRPVIVTKEIIDLYSGDWEYGSKWSPGGVQDCFRGYAQGSIDLGVANEVNRAAATIYYLAIGYDLAALSPTGGVDPTWVEHGDSLIGDAGAGTSNANKVEKYLEDAFLQEHADAGTHSSPPFDFRIETGTYTGNATDDRVISLILTDLDIKYLVITPVGEILLKTEDLAGDNTKENDVAAFQANDIQDITTNGQFTIGDDAKINTNTTVYYYTAIGV